MRRRYWFLLHLLIGLLLFSFGQYFWAVEESEVGRALGLLGGVILVLLVLWGLSFPIERRRKREMIISH
jgi:drug/metabolite transporter superfamily protein YnfA